MTASIKTTAVFLRPFQLASFDETLPAGEYEIETRLLDPVDWIKPGTWTSSVLVRLHTRASHPGLSRTLTVPLAELENAVAKDKLTGKALTDYCLDEMLADELIQLVMKADGWTEGEMRDLYGGRSDKKPEVAEKSDDRVGSSRETNSNEAGPSIGSARPGIGE
jgi:hypothetical protein